MLQPGLQTSIFAQVRNFCVPEYLGANHGSLMQQGSIQLRMQKNSVLLETRDGLHSCTFDTRD